MLLLLALHFVIAGDTELLAISQTQSVARIVSPSGMLLRDSEFIVCTGRLDPIPSILSWPLTAQQPQPSQQIALSSYYLYDLFEDEQGAWLLTSKTSPYYSQRTIELHQLDLASRNIAFSAQVDLAEYCSVNEFCPLSSAVTFADNMIAATSETPSSLLILKKDPKGRYVAKTRRHISLNRRFCSISDILIVEDHLWLLVRNQWTIARAPLAELMGDSYRSIALEGLYSFDDLKKTFSTQNGLHASQGLAEAMTVDGKGKLWLLLSPAGDVFNETGNAQPVLIEAATRTELNP